MDREQPTVDHKRHKGKDFVLNRPRDEMGTSAYLENLDPLNFVPLHVLASQQPEGGPADLAREGSQSRDPGFPYAY